MIAGLSGVAPSFAASVPTVSTSGNAGSASGADDVQGADSARRRTDRTGQRSGVSGKLLSDNDLRRVRALQQRDRQVRSHEMAHLAAGGNLVRSGASFTYESAPDGQRYAIGGEVSIDISPGRTPEETISKAARIKAAAFAPADPSAQDRQIAALATRMAMQASIDLSRQSQNGTEAADRQARSQSAGDRMRVAYNADSASSNGQPSAIDLLA